MSVTIGSLCFGLSRFTSSIRDAATTQDALQRCRDRGIVITFFVNVGLDAVGLLFAPLIVMATMMPIKRIFDAIMCPDGGTRQTCRGLGCLGGLVVLTGVGGALAVATLLTRGGRPPVGQSSDIVVGVMVVGGLMVTGVTRAQWRGNVAPGMLAAGAACATRALLYTATPMWRVWYYAMAAMVSVVARWTIAIWRAPVDPPSPHVVGLSVGWHMVTYVVAGGVGLREMDGWDGTSAFGWILALAVGCGGVWAMASEQKTALPRPHLPAVRFVPQMGVCPPPPYVMAQVVQQESVSPPPYEA